MYNFKEIEEEAKEVWKKNKTQIEKALKDNPKKPLFSFLEGPPTANAPPGLHHLEARTFKDIINKFRYMQGYNVPRKAGWDCHGLPVEVQMEKKLGLKNKKDILNYGVEEFVKKARESVFSNISDWEKSTEKMGYWIDLKEPYVTLENKYIESVWWSLKELYKKRLLYEAHKVVPFCPRCETPLSSHEVAQGYEDVQEDSVYVAFKIKGKKDEYILAWTTTPWTLPGNVALAVGKDIDYVKVEISDKSKLVLGKEKLNLIKGDYKILEKLKGKNLEGVEYEPLYDIKETQNENSHKVILADFVTTEDGTGIVHTAVMYGEDDYEVGIKKGLPAVHTVGEDGRFLEIVKKFKDKFVKDAEKEIIQDLKERKLLFKTEKITHSYPFCWRCNSPLIYYAINSWFVKVTEYKERIIELNQKINWVPKHIKDGRFGEWLTNLKDWALSRKKFWGTPLPIWKCECGNEEAIGSIEELKKRSIKKISDKEIDLHKPWIDNVKLKCAKCKKEMSRVQDVIDCWYDSGSAIFAQFHYPFENKEIFKKRFPYDFIAEGMDQTRGWFYTMHVLATMLFNNIAYKNVISTGLILDENGEKMSKSKGNILNPDQIIDAVGVDATRLEFCTISLGEPKKFGIHSAKQDVLPFLNVLWNTFQFYNQLEDYKKTEKKIEDKWILSRLNSTIKEATENLENYYLDKALKPILNFVVNDFSKTYIKIIREREDKNVDAVCKEVLDNVAKLLAPYAPNITEVIHKRFGKESVHLSSWPKVDKKKIDKGLELKFNIMLDILEKGLAERDKAQIGLKWPLAKTTIYSKEHQSLTDLQEIIKSQLNVKEIELKVKHNSNEISVELDIKLTPELEAEGYAREMSRQVQAFRKNLGLSKSDKIELFLIADEELKNILETQNEFIKKRTNSKKINIVTSCRERFKNKSDFKIKDKRGEIGIIC